MDRRWAWLLVAAAAAVLVGLPGCSSTEQGSPTSAASSTELQAPARSPLPGREDYVSVSYDDPEHWLCHPSDPDDPCDGELDATVVGADGRLTRAPFERADDPGVDCFYVYPTVSADAGAVSDWEPGPQEIGTTLMQAARVQEHCRLFVPIYRQITTAGLGGRAAAGPAAADPFSDVLDAFLTYLAQDHGGRGIVLIGHSQGSVWLSKLLAEVIDPDPELRSVLVGAYLPGTDVRVPEGEVIGGSFEHVPLCAEAEQVGCVTTWQAVDHESPPVASVAVTPAGAKACVAPGTVAGAPSQLTPVYQTVLAPLIGPGPDGMGGGAWVEDPAVDIATPYVVIPDMATARCSVGPTEGVLEVEVRADGSDARLDELPLYGTRGADLHLVELMLAQGEVVASIEAQGGAYLASSGG
jgi:hypothetical protein